MGAVQVQHYLGRARDFLKAMELLKEDLTEFKCSSALLGIHGALSYCDALRAGLGSRHLSSEDHRTAPKELRTLLAARKFGNLQAIDRLVKLLSEKSVIAYAPRTISQKSVLEIIQQARRFALWAEATGKQLKIEGWQDA
jgi:hypothetical protein